MTVANLITGGVGPGGNIAGLVTYGLLGTDHAASASGYIGIPDVPDCLTKSHWDYASLTYDYVDDGGVQTYRQANDGPYTHYIDPTHPSATNTSNPYGTPSKPRLFVLLNTLAPGSVVEYHNFTTTSWTTTSGINGTEALPIFIRADTNDRSFILRQLLLRDSISYVIFENVDFDKNDLNTALVESDWNSSADVCSYLAFRDCDIHNLANVPNQGRVAMYFGHRTGVGIDDNILIKDCRFYDWGFGRTAATNYDCTGIFVGPRVSYVWILGNTFDQLGGDSIQLNAQSQVDGPHDPPHHVYIAGNTSTRMFENFIDLKTCNDVVISQNTAYNMGILCEGNDIGETNGAGGGFIRTGPGDATYPTQYRYNVFVIFNHFYNGGCITVAEGDQWGSITATNTRNTELPADEVYFIGNLIHDVHNAAGDSQCITLSDQARVYFLNNTFYNVDQAAQLVFKLRDDTQTYTDAKTFANNIIVQHADATRNALEMWSLSSAFAAQVVRNNIWYKDGGGDVPFRVGIQPTPSGAISYTAYDTYAAFAAAYATWATESANSDPKLTAPTNDCSLQADSPAVDAGWNHGAYTTFNTLYDVSIAYDYRGMPITAASSDIGAYEYVSPPIYGGFRSSRSNVLLIPSRLKLKDTKPTLWMDARDADIVDLAGKIVSWTSRDSSATIFAQGTSAQRPGFSSSIVTFDGGDHLYGPDANAILSMERGRIFVVAKTTVTDAEQILLCLFDLDYVTEDRYLMLGISADNKMFYKFDLESYTADELVGDDTVGTDYHLFEYAADGSTISMWLDGVQQSLSDISGDNNGKWAVDVTGGDIVNIGGMGHTGAGTHSGYLTGEIKGVLAYEPDKSPAGVTKVRRLIANYYGITI